MKVFDKRNILDVGNGCRPHRSIRFCMFDQIGVSDFVCLIRLEYKILKIQ